MRFSDDLRFELDAGKQLQRCTIKRSHDEAQQGSKHY